MAETTSKNPPHVYGGADREDKQGPAPQGMRGEAAAPLDPDATSPDQIHETDVVGGRVTVQETSGTAFAESAGRAGLARESMSQGDRKGD